MIALSVLLPLKISIQWLLSFHKNELLLNNNTDYQDD